MKKILLFLLLLLTAGSEAIDAVPAVSFELEVAQQDSLTQSSVRVYLDTVTVVKDIEATGFIGPLSVDIDVTAIDSIRTGFTLYAVSIGPVTYSTARQFTVEYGLPAIISDIKAKNDSRYSLKVIPLEQFDVDTSFCGINHRTEGTFSSNPTAYTDIYFVPYTYGDYFWESTKAVVEKSYRQFKDYAHFNLPGKYSIFLYPCQAYSLIWDKRFGMAFDPGRSNCFAIFNKGISTIDPYLITHAAILKNYGYAPPFISEGLSNYFGFTIYDMQQILKEGDIPSLDSALDSYTYLQLDPRIADRMSSTFAKYLIDSYGLGQFVSLYSASDDINLKSNLQVMYDNSIATLEEEWLTYVDTLTLTVGDFANHLVNVEMMQRYDEMLTYSEVVVGYATTRADSLASLNYLKRAYFYNGNYYKAIDIQKLLLEMNNDDAIGTMALGSYNMMAGNYDKADDLYKQAQAMDTANQMIRFNQAMLLLHTGDTTAAKEILLANLSNKKGSVAQSETRVLLGQILQHSENEADREAATKYFSEAAAAYQQIIQVNKASSNLYLWLGMASLGLNETDPAIDYLNLASFLEPRPFYLGMINLWLGKTYLAAEKPELAKEAFGRVLSLASSNYHQAEAKQLLDSL